MASTRQHQHLAMPSRSISSIKALNAAIATDNPFPLSARVSDREIWGSQLPNLSSLNDCATRVVLQALQQARQGQSPLNSIAVLGNPGTGKSHLIAHLRHQVQRDARALFAYINAGQFTDINLLRYQFLQRVVESLRHPGSGGIMQWQWLAAAIASAGLRSLHCDPRILSPSELSAKLNANPLAKNQAWIDRLTDAQFLLKPDFGDPDLVRAIIWTLCNAQAPYSIKWLSGQEIGQAKAEELGLPNPPREHRDADAWENLVHLFDIISAYYPLIICFDQVEARDKSETGLKRERVVASLIKRIWDTVPRARLDRGIVILNVMTEETWKTRVEPLPQGIAAYLCKHKEPMQLRAIAGDNLVELVRQWLQGYYRRHNLTPPTPIYPFDRGQLEALGREKLTLREALEWCAENFRPVEDDPFEQVETAWEAAIAAVEKPEIFADNSRIGDALYFAFYSAVGEEIGEVTIHGVSDEIQRHYRNGGYLNFRALGYGGGKGVAIAVAVLQDNHAKKVEAGLKRLVQYNTFALTCGCLIRDRHRPIPSHWQAYGYLQQLIGDRGGKWVDLNRADITPLLALRWIHQHREEYGIQENQILEYIRDRRLVVENRLMQAIVRDSVPSGELDELFVAQIDDPLCLESSEFEGNGPDLAQVDAIAAEGSQE